MHRDVKPANVFLTSDGVVKVADLGLGRYFASRSDGVTLSVVGTPYYMAPERLAQAEYTYVVPATEMCATVIVVIVVFFPVCAQTLLCLVPAAPMWCALVYFRSQYL